MATVQEIIQKASAEVGVKEYPANSNRCKYNQAFYGKDVSGSQYPWCCAFIWWLLSTSGITVPKTALCTSLASYFKTQGQWYTSDPQVGDIVFFKFGTNNRWTNHVGIVTAVRGNVIETIEGNTSINSDDNGGAVMARERRSNIVGYGRPKYTTVHEVAAPSTNLPTLKRGSRGAHVKAWQEYLLTCCISVGPAGPDGVYGRDTENAVRLYQKRKHLPITGVVDADDWMSVGS